MKHECVENNTNWSIEKDGHGFFLDVHAEEWEFWDGVNYINHCPFCGVKLDES